MWEWENDSGSWTPYDMDVGITIQRAYEKQHPWVDLSAIGFCYVIDFATMGQINRQTQRKRRVRRRLDMVYPLVSGTLPKSQSWPASPGAAAAPPVPACACPQCLLVMSVKATVSAAGPGTATLQPRKAPPCATRRPQSLSAGPRGQGTQWYGPGAWLAEAAGSPRGPAAGSQHTRLELSQLHHQPPWHGQWQGIPPWPRHPEPQPPPAPGHRPVPGTHCLWVSPAVCEREGSWGGEQVQCNFFSPPQGTEGLQPCGAPPCRAAITPGPGGRWTLAVPNLPWAKGSAGPLSFPAGAWGVEQGWGGSCISMRRLRLLFLLVAGDGWGTAKGPKKSHSGPMRRGASRPPPSKDTFFSRGWVFNEPVSPLCLALLSAFCCSLAPFLSFSILPLPSAPDLPGNFPMEESPKGRGGKSCGSDVAVGEKRKKRTTDQPGER